MSAIDSNVLLFTFFGAFALSIVALTIIYCVAVVRHPATLVSIVKLLGRLVELITRVLDRLA